MNSTTSLSEAAREYVEQAGVPVFPLYGTHDGECDCGNPDCSSPGKHPRVRWKEEATLDSDQVAAWWEQWPNSNIGMPTGLRSCYWVVDIDPPDGNQTFETLRNGYPDLPTIPIQTTGRLGKHLFFGYEKGIGCNPLAPHLDIRGEGGYVVLPPSRHITGRIYEWDEGHTLLDIGPQDAPDWLVRKVKAPPIPPIRLVGAETDQDGLFGKVRTGSRNNMLYRLARSFHVKQFDQAAALAALRAANAQGTEQPLADSEVCAIAYNAYKQPDRPSFTEEREMAALSIVLEDAGEAEVSNAEYLSRPPLVDRLLYPRHFSLSVGGKHGGKTTGERTLALSVSRGLDVYGRTTRQTSVLYAASDDEYAVTRNELLRMGWNKNDPLWLVRQKKASSMADAERVLADIARKAREYDARFIVLDMLFDFIRISDEIKYAQTRDATAPIQTLADEIDGHVSATHHSPKWMLETASAAQAALGSQGVSARCSPIVLYRRWADELYTVESSMTRDPRGLALEQTCIKLDENGWGHASGPFQPWMKWRLYAPRIIALFQGDEPGTEWSTNQVKEALEIDRATAQNALYHMHLDGQIQRKTPHRGRRFLYRLPITGLFNDNEWS